MSNDTSLISVLLVNPEMTFQGSVPLGLAAITGYAQKHGYNIDLFSCQGKELSKVQSKLVEQNWDIIGFTGLISQYKDLKYLTNRSRELHPHAVIVMGGPLANAIPDFLISSLNIDLAICGEGEIPFLEILDCCRNKTSYAGISGAVYRDNSGNLVRNTEAHVSSMDDLPLMPFDGFEIEPYAKNPMGRTIDIQLSRGCPNSCSFCDNSLFPKQIRRRSKENIVQELQRIRRQYDFEFIYLADLNPFVASGLVRDFCDVLCELDFRVKWYGNAFAQVMKIEELDYLVKGKCGGLHFGIESGSQEILVTYNKHIDLSRNRLIIKAAIERGVEAKVNWIIGAPNETTATIRESIEYFVSLGVVPALKYLTPLPGTLLYDLAVSRGKIGVLEDYLLKYKDWYDDKPLCNISKFGDDELVEIAHEAIDEISTRIGISWPKWSGVWRGSRDH